LANLRERCLQNGCVVAMRDVTDLIHLTALTGLTLQLLEISQRRVGDVAAAMLAQHMICTSQSLSSGYNLAMASMPSGGV
jgi:hypothetical protein